MPLNPSKKEEALNSPVVRANELNDPQFSNEQGYFAYDLTHSEFITPLFGQITPTMHIDTVPADRIVVKENSKTILNQINGNLLSTINQYSDSFFVSLRNVFPTNYEKLIPNPTKGGDLPNSALPQVPFGAFIMSYLEGDDIPVNLGDGNETTLINIKDEISQAWEVAQQPYTTFALSRMSLLATVLSRGQLLDYFGLQFDTTNVTSDGTSQLQTAIDNFFDALYAAREYYLDGNGELPSTEILPNDILVNVMHPDRSHKADEIKYWRSALSDIFEAGRMPVFDIDFSEMDEKKGNLVYAYNRLEIIIKDIFYTYKIEGNQYEVKLEDINSDSDPFSNGGCINIGKILAYQQVVAHYYTNDKVDNIFSSDLFMQLLRSVMFPSEDGFMSKEPCFEYNGVTTEYDYISYGGFFTSLINNIITGTVNRQYLFMTLMFLMRRSLRYGDYFSTARPNLLAVGDLGINVSGGNVSPIDVTKNLLMQRYLNAANYIGSGFLNYMSSIYGVRPSDTGSIPRFVSHRKTTLQNQITNNTADDQGAQTTNIIGFTEDGAMDCFIDDFGYLITLASYDVLPVYSSGIDSTYHFADRFDYFNPMLQNLGDQEIRSSELLGNPSLYNQAFGYTMRNSEYKYKLSKAHGAFVNSLPQYMVKYPLDAYRRNLQELDLEINPDFIRDKPVIIDRLIPQMTGSSPANYYHFIVSCVNQVMCARKIQATPAVLF